METTNYDINSRGGLYRPGQAYSSDLRQRILFDLANVCESDGALPRGTNESLSSKYKVSPSVITCLHKRILSCPSFDPESSEFNGLIHGKVSEKEEPHLTRYEIEYVVLLLDQNPSLYLRELQQLIANHLGSFFSISAIHRTLQNIGLTRKKLSRVHIRRFTPANLLWRQKYLEMVAQFPQSQLYFFDECGFAVEDTQRQYGRSFDRRSFGISHWQRGMSIQLLSVLGCKQILSIEFVEGTITGEIVAQFFLRHVYPSVPPNALIIMDNAKTHHGWVERYLSALFATKNCAVLYLPPYSPDMNPIENMFGTIKSHIKELNPGYSVLNLIVRALLSITEQQCTNWFRHCGYY